VAWERGVSGDGERDVRLLFGVVYKRGTAGWLCMPDAKVGRDKDGDLDVAGLGLGSFVPARELLEDFSRRSGVDRLVLFEGDLARLAESKSQCFQWAN